MSEARLPKLFRDALEAQDAADAVGYEEHPRIYQRLWDAVFQARDTLRQEYPLLEAWLFPYAGDAQARWEDLRKLLAEAQKEASDVHP